MVCVLVKVSIAMMKQDDQKQAGEEIAYLTLPNHYLSLEETRTGAQTDRDLEAGTDTEATEEYGFLACSSGTTTLPHQSPIKKMPFRLAYSPILERPFSTEAPSSLMTLACVKLI